jgi:hypothetical protein
MQRRWNSFKVSEEKPKVAQHHSHKLAFVYAIPHLLPVLACTALLALNLRTTFIGDVSTVTLTALQFAAKALEILIQGSIAAIVLAIVRVQLLSAQDFPFGGAIAPYRVTDASYLWSRDLWGALTAKWCKGWNAWLVLAALPMAVVLANLVGPSVAVLVSDVGSSSDL